MDKAQVKTDARLVADLVGQKVETTRKIRELRVELSRLNGQLIKAGAGIHEIAAW